MTHVLVTPAEYRVRVRDVDRSRGGTIAHIRIHAPGASHNIVAPMTKNFTDVSGVLDAAAEIAPPRSAQTQTPTVIPVQSSHP